MKPTTILLLAAAAIGIIYIPKKQTQAQIKEQAVKHQRIKRMHQQIPMMLAGTH